MWFPFLNFLSEKNGEIVFQNFLSSFEHLSSKCLRMEFLGILTTKYLMRLFASQEDFSSCYMLQAKSTYNYWKTFSLQWRHNDHDGVSNHQLYDCLHNRSFRCRSKKTSKLRVTGLCVGNSPVTGEFLTQRASNAENVSIWWRHHVLEYKGAKTRHKTAASPWPDVFQNPNLRKFLTIIGEIHHLLRVRNISSLRRKFNIILERW